MDLKHVLSKLETATEEDTESLLQQYNREVSGGSAFSTLTQTNAGVSVSWLAS